MSDSATLRFFILRPLRNLSQIVLVHLLFFITIMTSGSWQLSGTFALLLQETSNIALSLLVELFEEHFKIIFIFTLYRKLLAFKHIIECSQLVLLPIVFFFRTTTLSSLLLLPLIDSFLTPDWIFGFQI